MNDTAKVKKVLPSLSEAHAQGRRDAMEDASSTQLVDMTGIEASEVKDVMQDVVDALQKGVDDGGRGYSEDGTTFLAAVAKDQKLHVSFLGDSECGLLKQDPDGSYRFERIIKRDMMHSPHFAGEEAAARAAGALCLGDAIGGELLGGRLSTTLAVSRSIHTNASEKSFYSRDPRFMHQLSHCEIDLATLNDSDHLVLSCDGVTEPDTSVDKDSNQTPKLNAAITTAVKSKPLEAARVIESALALNTGDNVSAIMVNVGELKKACRAQPNVGIMLNINDGHGGRMAAEYVANNLERVTEQQVQQFKETRASDEKYREEVPPPTTPTAAEEVQAEMPPLPQSPEPNSKQGREDYLKMHRKDFDANLTTAEAVQQLLKGQPAGTYVIRPYSQPGCFTLSVKQEDGSVNNTRLEATHDGWDLAGTKVKSIDHMLKIEADEFYGFELRPAPKPDTTIPAASTGSNHVDHHIADEMHKEFLELKEAAAHDDKSEAEAEGPLPPTPD